MSIRFFRLLCLGLGLGLGLGLAWLPPGHSATLTEFIADMSARHGFDAAALQRLFQQTEVKKSIIKIMDRSNTGKPLLRLSHAAALKLGLGGRGGPQPVWLRVLAPARGR